MKKKQIIGLLFIIGIFFSIQSTASSQTLTVGEDKDYQTIQSAVDAASNGDEIVVDQGVYTENIDIDKPVTIRTAYGAYGPDEVTIVASIPSDHIIDIQSDHVTIQGFIMYGAQEYAAIYIDQHKDCSLIDNTCGISLEQNNYMGIVLQDADDNYLNNNKAIGNTVGIVLNKGETGDGCSNNVMVGNICSLNSSGGITVVESSGNYMDINQCTDNYPGNGITLYLSSDNDVIANTCTGNNVGIMVDGSQNHIIKNVCNNNGFGFMIGWTTTGSKIYYNRSEDNTIGIYSLGCSGNQIFLNSFQSNTSYNALSWNSSNQWQSPIPVTYYSQGIACQSYLGNYYSNHNLTDLNGDLIADIANTIPFDNTQDSYALVVPFEAYDITDDKF